MEVCLPVPTQGGDKSVSSCLTLQGVFDPLFLPLAPQVLLASDLAPRQSSLASRSHPFLTQVPDVGVVAHAHGRALELQAGIGHGQLLVTIRVPGEVCGCPLDLLRVPGVEGRESKGMEGRAPQFCVYQIPFQKKNPSRSTRLCSLRNRFYRVETG